MCTLSILRMRAGRVSLRFNRDEQRDRVAGGPLERVAIGDRVAIRPIDPEGGGTWIGANDAGIVLAILNRTPPSSKEDAPARRGGASRGIVVATLLGVSSLDDVLEHLPKLAEPIMRRWRLIALDGVDLVEAIGGDGAVSIERSPLDDSILRASSGLGDERVIAPRREAFERSVLAGSSSDALDLADLVEAQRAFHASRWPDRGAEAPDMSRADAWTVSRTSIEIAWDDAIELPSRRRGVITIGHANRIDETRYAEPSVERLAFERSITSGSARA